MERELGGGGYCTTCGFDLALFEDTETGERYVGHNTDFVEQHCQHRAARGAFVANYATYEQVDTWWRI